MKKALALLSTLLLLSVFASSVLAAAPPSTRTIDGFYRIYPECTFPWGTSEEVNATVEIYGAMSFTSTNGTCDNAHWSFSPVSARENGKINIKDSHYLYMDVAKQDAAMILEVSFGDGVPGENTVWKTVQPEAILKAGIYKYDLSKIEGYREESQIWFRFWFKWTDKNQFIRLNGMYFANSDSFVVPENLPTVEDEDFLHFTIKEDNDDFYKSGDCEFSDDGETIMIPAGTGEVARVIDGFSLAKHPAVYLYSKENDAFLHLKIQLLRPNASDGLDFIDEIYMGLPAKAYSNKWVRADLTSYVTLWDKMQEGDKVKISLTVNAEGAYAKIGKDIYFGALNIASPAELPDDNKPETPTTGKPDDNPQTGVAFPYVLGLTAFGSAMMILLSAKKRLHAK
ncbi:MAG: hypothetical protein KHW59_07280 [Clostridiales bacterium]|nr:hypothetical protein [Clostridiales bacterium]